jgi:two-component system OmpR family sensor kinase
VRLPIRARITAAFAAVMLLLLIAVAALAYTSTSSALLDEIDSGLRFRADAVIQTSHRTALERPDARLQEPREAFEQFIDANGRVLGRTQGFDAPLLSPRRLRGVTRPRFFQRAVPGVADDARLLAVPLSSTAPARFLVVGVTMADRTDALRRLATVLLIGGPVAVAVACLAGWTVAGWALRPMDRMQQQAAAITSSGIDHRMPVPRTQDELRRLAVTLNAMLDRLAASMDTERAFLERASHELRTPLAALRAEVDLALGRERSADELAAALHSVSQETDRLARLADDLLVLARADSGRLPVHREPVSLRDMLESAAERFAGRAAELHVRVEVAAPATTVRVDPLRIRQALVNLLDNALRHSPPEATVQLTGQLDGDVVRIAVSDSGPGFDPAGADATGRGLGLRIVRAVAAGHGGTVTVARGDAGGAVVELVLSRS